MEVQRNVVEWTHRDHATGALGRARRETNHWTASTASAIHNYGKVVDQRAVNLADGLVQQRKQVEVFSSQAGSGAGAGAGSVQVLRVFRSSTTSSSSRSSFQLGTAKWPPVSDLSDGFGDLHLPLHPLDLSSEKTKANAGRSIGWRRPPTRVARVQQSAASSASEESTVADQTQAPIITFPSDDDSDKSPSVVSSSSQHNGSTSVTRHLTLETRKSCSSENLTARVSSDSGSQIGDSRSDGGSDLWSRTSAFRRSLQFPSGANVKKMRDQIEARESAPADKRRASDGASTTSSLRHSFVTVKSLNEVRERLRTPKVNGTESGDVIVSDDHFLRRKRDPSLSPTPDSTPTPTRSPTPVPTPAPVHVGAVPSPVQSYVFGMEKLDRGKANCSVAVETRKLDGVRSEEWYRRRKSYGFEADLPESKHEDSWSDRGSYKSALIPPTSPWFKLSRGAQLKASDDESKRPRSLFDQSAPAPEVRLVVRSADVSSNNGAVLISDDQLSGKTVISLVRESADMERRREVLRRPVERGLELLRQKEAQEWDAFRLEDRASEGGDYVNQDEARDMKPHWQREVLKRMSERDLVPSSRQILDMSLDLSRQRASDRDLDSSGKRSFKSTFDLKNISQPVTVSIPVVSNDSYILRSDNFNEKVEPRDNECTVIMNGLHIDDEPRSATLRNDLTAEGNDSEENEEQEGLELRQEPSGVHRDKPSSTEHIGHAFLSDPGEDAAQGKKKKVEFSKTEVHFAAEPGRFNLVATDDKPPPTNIVRGRRRQKLLAEQRLNKSGLPELRFGDSPLDDQSARTTIRVTMDPAASASASTSAPSSPDTTAVPMWRSTVTLRSASYQPAADEAGEPEFQRLLKNLRPTGVRQTLCGAVDTSSSTPGGGDISIVLFPQYRPKGVYSTKVNLGSSDATVEGPNQATSENAQPHKSSQDSISLSRLELLSTPLVLLANRSCGRSQPAGEVEGELNDAELSDDSLLADAEVRAYMVQKSLDVRSSVQPDLSSTASSTRESLYKHHASTAERMALKLPRSRDDSSAPSDVTRFTSTTIEPAETSKLPVCHGTESEQREVDESGSNQTSHSTSNQSDSLLRTAVTTYSSSPPEFPSKRRNSPLIALVNPPELLQKIRMVERNGSPTPSDERSSLRSHDSSVREDTAHLMHPSNVVKGSCQSNGPLSQCLLLLDGKPVQDKRGALRSRSMERQGSPHDARVSEWAAHRSHRHAELEGRRHRSTDRLEQGLLMEVGQRNSERVDRSNENERSSDTFEREAARISRAGSQQRSSESTEQNYPMEPSHQSSERRDRNHSKSRSSHADSSHHSSRAEGPRPHQRTVGSHRQLEHSGCRKERRHRSSEPRDHVETHVGLSEVEDRIPQRVESNNRAPQRDDRNQQRIESRGRRCEREDRAQKMASSHRPLERDRNQPTGHQGRPGTERRAAQVPPSERCGRAEKVVRKTRTHTAAMESPIAHIVNPVRERRLRKGRDSQTHAKPERPLRRTGRTAGTNKSSREAHVESTTKS